MSTTRERPMTPRQHRFVEEYLVDLNATQAAIKAREARGGAPASGGEGYR